MSTQQSTGSEKGTVAIFICTSHLFHNFIAFFLLVCPLTMRLNKRLRYMYRCRANKQSRRDVLERNVRGRHQKIQAN